MLQGELTTHGVLSGELTGGVFYGTNNYNELVNKPSVNGVTLSGDKTTADLGIILPTKTSDLTNDSGFITSADVPTKTSDLVNDSGFITAAAIPTKTSQLTNDSNFVVSSSLATVATTGSYTNLINKPTIPTRTGQLTNDSGFLTDVDVSTVALTGDYSDLLNKPTIPTKTSDLDNDSGFITDADLPTNLSDLNNDEGFIGFTELTGILTSGSTTLTISDAAITTTSTIDIYTDAFGIQPTNAVVTSGQIVLSFLAQASDISVKVRVS